MKTRCCAALLLALGLAACKAGPAVNPDMQSSFLNQRDLKEMTDRMARSLAGDPKVAALTVNGPITIVLAPVRNETEGEVMRQETLWLFVNRVAVLLSREPELTSRFQFVINKPDYDALVTREGIRPRDLANPENDRLKPEYVLKGVFTSLPHESKKSREDYYYCVFELTRIQPGATAGQVVWTDAYETRKVITRNFLD